jgi:hypothetical protein
MAKQKQQAAAAGDETPPVDTAEAATEAVAEILEVVDAPKFSAMVALKDSTGELHAIYMRFAEMLPLLSGAIEQAEGELKDFLHAFADHL